MRAVSIILAVLFLASAHAAGEEAQGPRGQIYFETYYLCATSDERRVDEIIAAAEQPVYDDAVDRGEIIHWAWRTHESGAPWRRAFVEVAEDDESLFAAQDRASGAFARAFPKERKEFQAICTSHQDYIWRSIDHSSTDGFNAPMTLTALFDCRAETATARKFASKGAAFLEAQINAGAIEGWAWLEKRIGAASDFSLRIYATDRLQALAAYDGFLKADVLQQCSRDEQLWRHKIAR